MLLGTEGDTHTHTVSPGGMKIPGGGIFSEVMVGIQEYPFIPQLRLGSDLIKLGQTWSDLVQGKVMVILGILSSLRNSEKL